MFTNNSLFIILVFINNMFYVAYADNVKFNINRIQFLQSLEKNSILNFSSFTKFEKSWYSLQYIELSSEILNNGKNDYIFFENYIGHPTLLKYEALMVGLVTRTQAIYKEDYESSDFSQSIGLQINFGGLLTKSKSFETFLQCYPLKIEKNHNKSHDLLRYYSYKNLIGPFFMIFVPEEILHYYSYKNLIGPLSIRGYNYVYFFDDKLNSSSKVFYKIQIDIMYPMKNHYNFNIRYWYQNATMQNGKKGSNIAVGVRYSF